MSEILTASLIIIAPFYLLVGLMVNGMIIDNVGNKYYILAGRLSPITILFWIIIVPILLLITMVKHYREFW